ncbi:hyalin-like, partial [Anneissia japonica]|uniref:hyalin-like n=1 Tax=Anneissia japonica TaxID=1529436 RepID=UPI0014256EB0
MDITVNTTSGQPVAVNVTWTEPIATDNSKQTPEPESDYTSGDNMFLIGHTTVQYNVSDSSGNFNDRCNFTVTVEDKELPVPSCPLLVTGVTDEGKPNGTVNYNITVMDNVQVAMFSTNYTNINPAAMTIDAAYAEVETTGVFPIGQTVIEYIFVDSASPTSNEATCYITLQIEDEEKPEIVDCPRDITVNTTSGQPVAVNVTWTEPTANDNSKQTPEPESDYTSGDNMFLIGHTTVQYNVSDSSGNFNDRCNFTVTVEDKELPVPSCPSLVTGVTDEGKPNGTVNYNITVMDNVQVAMFSTNYTNINPAAMTIDAAYAVVETTGVFPIGQTVIEYIFVDSASPTSNEATCYITLQIEDEENPEIVDCPMDITVNTTRGQPVAVNVTWTEPTANDNSKQTPEPKSDYTSGDNMFLIGHTTVQYNVSDSSGNFNDRCNFTVTVEDKELPVPSCPSLVTGVTDEGKPNGTVNYNITVMDNVQVAMFSTNYTNINPAAMTVDAAYAAVETTGVFPIGETVIEYIFVDSASPTSNEATCYITLKIEDEEKPEIVDCPMDIKVNTTSGQPVAVNVTWTEPTATDNSKQTQEPESDYTSGDNMFLIGHTTVQYNVSDSSGNFNDRCNFTVTVEDKELPVPSCPSLVTGVTDEGKPNGTVNYNITVMDNVQVAMFSTNYTNINPAVMTIDAAYAVVETTGVFPIGQTVIEYIFVDSASPTSNEATCYITLQIE